MCYRICPGYVGQLAASLTSTQQYTTHPLVVTAKHSFQILPNVFSGQKSLWVENHYFRWNYNRNYFQLEIMINVTCLFTCCTISRQSVFLFFLAGEFFQDSVSMSFPYSTFSRKIYTLLFDPPCGLHQTFLIHCSLNKYKISLFYHEIKYLCSVYLLVHQPETCCLFVMFISKTLGNHLHNLKSIICLHINNLLPF